MLTSATYQLRSSGESEKHPSAVIDPENNYLWRMNPRRMEAEVVRDSVLSLAGELDTTMGGPEIDESKGLESKRRSIYFRHSPDTQMEFLKVFDGPNPVECYERNVSVVPQQALALANSELSVRMAQVLAAKIGVNESSIVFVNRAFETILGRPPNEQERTAAIEFLDKQPNRLATWQVSDPTAARARENLVHVLLNHNDFVTIR
jgi:PAS domain-containing protein